MSLKSKITTMTMFLGVFVLGVVSSLYIALSSDKVEHDAKNVFIQHTIDDASFIKDELKEKLVVAKTIGLAPVLVNGLEKSNAYYDSLSKKEQKIEIKKLNTKWKKERTQKSTFIKTYLSNEISKYLKQQQIAFPGIYGEIFLTNRYGAMIATTGVLSTLAHSQKYWWKQAYNKGEGKVFFDDRGFDDSVNGYVLGVVIPIKKDKQIIGILKANENILGTLNTIIKKHNALHKGVAKIVRSKGLVVLEEGKTPLSTKVNKNIINKLLSQTTGILKEKDNFVIYTPILLSKDKSIGFGGIKSRLNDHEKGNENEIWHMVITVDKKIIDKESEQITKIIIYIVLLLLVVSAIFSFFIGTFVSNRVVQLAKVVKKFGKGELDLRADIQSNDEIGTLGKSFNMMADNLEQTMISRDELKEEVEKRKQIEQKLIGEMKKSYELNQNMHEKEEIMIAQSRHAAMGEMIGMIAHQWRQPLGMIAMGANNIIADVQLESISEEALLEVSQEILFETDYLSKTIDDFRDFFRPGKNVEKVDIKDIFDEVFKIMGKSLEINNIKVVKSFHTNKKIETYSRELLQVFINILKNAKEALVEHTKKDRKIEISVDKLDKIVMITIKDNAGGIDKSIMSKIFEPYFSTKDEKNGTGLGLYMSKTIVEKHLKGSIKVLNHPDGAVFEIVLPFKLGKGDEVNV